MNAEEVYKILSEEMPHTYCDCSPSCGCPDKCSERYSAAKKIVEYSKQQDEIESEELKESRSEWKEEKPKLLLNILYEFTDHKTMTIKEVDFEDVVNKVIDDFFNPKGTNN